MTQDLLLAIDQGTTGTTCLLVDSTCETLGRSNREFAQHFPRPGWVEHDPEELWASVVGTIADVLRGSGADPARIRAIGITNQRETTLIWDRSNGKPIHRALVWQDRRTADLCEALTARGWLPRVRELTGLVLDPYFSGTKIAWLLDHVKGSRDAAERGALAAGTVDTYLLWRMSGGVVHATEPSNACRTLLWPLRGGGWSEELCDALGVPVPLLPEVMPSNARFGETRGIPGLPDGIPIHGILGDQQAALFGQRCFASGQAKCTYGTGAFIVLNTADRIVPSTHGLLTSVAWQLDETTSYCLEGSSFMAGAVVQWLRDQLGFVATSAEIEDLALSVPDSGGVVLVPAHAGLGAPHWRPHARGALLGLTRGTNRGHIARAALEGVALQIADLVEAMAADTRSPLAVLRVDGGAADNALLMQTQADLLGIPLERPSSLESTALGAASLAGLGSGLWPNIQALQDVWSLDRTFEPAPPSAAIESLRAAWHHAVSLL